MWSSSFGERLMLSGFAMLFHFGHRAWKVSDPKAADCMGLGPFNLIRREAYEKIGTFRALRMEVIEDMKLGKLVKQHGLAQRNVLGQGCSPGSGDTAPSALSATSPRICLLPCNSTGDARLAPAFCSAS